MEHEVLQQVLIATYWLDPGHSGPPCTAVIRFTGHRAGVTGALSPKDRFEQVETVEGLIPGSGPVAITTKVQGITAGKWLVRAVLVSQHSENRRVRPWTGQAGASRWNVNRWLRSKGNPVRSARPGTDVTTRMAAFVTAPGMIAGSWAGLVAAGLITALVMLAAVAGRLHVAVGSALVVAAVASLAGAAGARAWYVVLQRGTTGGIVTRGLCVQGFVAGAVAAGIPALLLAHVPAGTFFDAATPGLFLAMAIGRQGCFFTGCCAGRQTASRWGIWSSDGHVGARRLPAQQLESLTCLLIGGAALLAALRLGQSAGGAVFIGAMATYILMRQVLLGLRAEPRRWVLARPVTLSVAAMALTADIVTWVLR
jgi:phosphatidylglycerol:prolipoprotein diacylglycerol transferase